MRALSTLVFGLCACAGCVTAPVVDVGGVDVLDLASSSDVAVVGGAWEWQPTAFTPTGAVPPPDDARWSPLAPEELATPRGRQGASIVWYRLRVTLPPTLGGAPIDGKPLLLALAIDDYGEVVVDGALAATAAGYNGVLTALLTPRAVVGAHHEVLVLGINGVLGRPPVFPPLFVLTNEVFVRTPIRLVVDATAPVPRRRITAHRRRSLAPVARCGVVVTERVLSPTIDELGPSRCPAAVDGQPRWHRYRVDVDADGLLELSDDQQAGYAEIWIDGALDLAFGTEGAGAMSRVGGVQQVPIAAGHHDVDVLLWPGPLSRSAPLPTELRPLAELSLVQQR